MSTIQTIPFMLALVPVVIWTLGQLSRLAVFDWIRPVTDFLNILIFLGPMLFYDYIGLLNINLLNTAGGPLWHDFVYILTMSCVFFGIGKLILTLFYGS